MIFNCKIESFCSTQPFSRQKIQIVMIFYLCCVNTCPHKQKPRYSHHLFLPMYLVSSFTLMIHCARPHLTPSSPCKSSLPSPHKEHMARQQHHCQYYIICILFDPSSIIVCARLKLRCPGSKRLMYNIPYRQYSISSNCLLIPVLSASSVYHHHT